MHIKVDQYSIYCNTLVVKEYKLLLRKAKWFGIWYHENWQLVQVFPTDLDSICGGIYANSFSASGRRF